MAAGAAGLIVGALAGYSVPRGGELPSPSAETRSGRKISSAVTRESKSSPPNRPIAAAAFAPREGQATPAGDLLGSIPASDDRAARDVVTNSFTGSLSFAGQTNANLVATTVTASSYVLSAEIEKLSVDSSAAVDRFMASQWSTNSLDATKYLEFSLSATPGPGGPFANFISLDLNFALRRSSSGPRQFQWRSSLDGFATAITNFTSLNSSVMLAEGVITLPDTASTETFAGNSFLIGPPSLLSATNLRLRLYGFQAKSQFGQGGLDTPLTFAGNIAVAEPSTVALLCLGLTTGIFLKLRRSR